MDIDGIIEGHINRDPNLIADNFVARPEVQRVMSVSDDRVMWAVIRELRQRILVRDDLLRRLHGWDIMDSTGDGPYWRGEIEKTVKLVR